MGRRAAPDHREARLEAPPARRHAVLVHRVRVGPGDRKVFGEYYTPDGLAALIVREALDENVALDGHRTGRNQRPHQHPPRRRWCPRPDLRVPEPSSTTPPGGSSMLPRCTRSAPDVRSTWTSNGPAMNWPRPSRPLSGSSTTTLWSSPSTLRTPAVRRGRDARRTCLLLDHRPMAGKRPPGNSRRRGRSTSPRSGPKAETTTPATQRDRARVTTRKVDQKAPWNTAEKLAPWNTAEKLADQPVNVEHRRELHGALDEAIAVCRAGSVGRSSDTARTATSRDARGSHPRLPAPVTAPFRLPCPRQFHRAEGPPSEARVVELRSVGRSPRPARRRD